MDEAIIHHQDTVRQHHVVVLDHDRISATQFLSRQGLADGIGHNYDSKWLFGSDQDRADMAWNGQRAGNVHYYHFNDAGMPYDLANPVEVRHQPSDIRSCLDLLKQRLKAKGESLDALVLAGRPSGYEHLAVKDWITSLKQQFPGVKVFKVAHSEGHVSSFVGGDGVLTIQGAYDAAGKMVLKNIGAEPPVPQVDGASIAQQERVNTTVAQPVRFSSASR